MLVNVIKAEREAQTVKNLKYVRNFPGQQIVRR